jgi:hypothetical protein
MTKCAIGFAVVLLAASSAFAQVDADNLRAKYGQPLDREIFTVRPGIDMVVAYGASKQACRLQLPSGMKIVGTFPIYGITKERIDEVLNEVVPLSIRGKELNRMMVAVSGPMHSLTVYEHVTISELQIDGVGQGITVTFKDPACPKHTAP